MKKNILLSIARTFHFLKIYNNFVVVLLCKTYPVLEEKVGKYVDFERYFDFYVVFEMLRGERIRHRSLVCTFVRERNILFIEKTIQRGSLIQT